MCVVGNHRQRGIKRGSCVENVLLADQERRENSHCKSRTFLQHEAIGGPCPEFYSYGNVDTCSHTHIHTTCGMRRTAPQPHLRRPSKEWDSRCASPQLQRRNLDGTDSRVILPWREYAPMWVVLRWYGDRTERIKATSYHRNAQSDTAPKLLKMVV